MSFVYCCILGMQREWVLGKVQAAKNMLTKGKNGVEGEIIQHNLERFIFYFLLAW